jgi:uncharacterized protein YhaN
MTAWNGNDRRTETSAQIEIIKRLDRMDQQLEGISKHTAQLAALNSTSLDQERRINKLEDKIDKTAQDYHTLLVSTNANKSVLTHIERTIWAGVTVVLAFGNEILEWAKKGG